MIPLLSHIFFKVKVIQNRMILSSKKLERQHWLTGTNTNPTPSIPVTSSVTNQAPPIMSNVTYPVSSSLAASALCFGKTPRQRSNQPSVESLGESVSLRMKKYADANQPGKAIRLAKSQGTMPLSDTNVLEQMQSKHPVSAPVSDAILRETMSSFKRGEWDPEEFIISKDMVYETTKKVKKYISAGADGVMPYLLKLFVAEIYRNDRYMDAFTQVAINDYAFGSRPWALWNIRLIVLLTKKHVEELQEGEHMPVRPIAVASALGIADKIIASQDLKFLEPAAYCRCTCSLGASKHIIRCAKKANSDLVEWRAPLIVVWACYRGNATSPLLFALLIAEVFEGYESRSPRFSQYVRLLFKYLASMSIDQMLIHHVRSVTLTEDAVDDMERTIKQNLLLEMIPGADELSIDEAPTLRYPFVSWWDWLSLFVFLHKIADLASTASVSSSIKRFNFD
ncbi:hypothetical protein PCE1_003217 [Barthelona sp. PCE]